MKAVITTQIQTYIAILNIKYLIGVLVLVQMSQNKRLKI